MTYNENGQKKKKKKHGSRSMNVLSALCCWKPRVESLPHNWPESLIITRSWGAACVSDCVSASISTSLLVFSTVFLCVCVCVYRKFDTPHPTPFWMKRVLRERRVQPTNHMAGQARCSGLGPYGRSGGLASSGSQDSEGNSGRMGWLEPAGHQPTRRFPRLSVSKHSMQNGMQNDSM